MRSWLWASLVACYSPAHLIGVSDGGGPDASVVPVDARVTCPDGTKPLGDPRFFEYCADGTEQSSTTLGGVITCDPTPQIDGVGSVCLVVAHSIAVGFVAQAHGPDPLVLVALDTIKIDPGATLDVSSTRSTNTGLSQVGAGANASFCQVATRGDDGTTGGGGGAGGSYAGVAGSGGEGIDSGVTRPGASPTPARMAPPIGVHGGCPGGAGGIASGDTPALQFGDSGGAVYLVAGTSITVTGTITASGDGGAGGTASGGGGQGGGAGGFIGLDAPAITITGSLSAVGGGGGGGGQGGGGGIAGGPGNGVIGGGPAGGAGSGGSGGRHNFGDSGSAATEGGGGGGGGGAGFIYLPVDAVFPATNVAPAPHH